MFKFKKKSNFYYLFMIKEKYKIDKMLLGYLKIDFNSYKLIYIFYILHPYY